MSTTCHGRLSVSTRPGSRNSPSRKPSSRPPVRLTRAGWCLLLVAGAMLSASLAGCQKLSLRSQNPDVEEEEVQPKNLTFIGDQVAVTGLHSIQIEAVGLVVNLDSTGGDSPPSMYRRMLIDDMHKRGVRSPNAILEDVTKTLVVVRADLPPTIRVGERFDIFVAIPESSEATSLRGGYLLETSLSEKAMVPGRGARSGHTLGKAEGPILLSTGEVEEDSKASVLKRGRIPGGGIYTGGLTKSDRLLGLYLRNDLRSGRQTERIADAIGRRYYETVNGRKIPMAKAKTDQYIELRVPERYRENYTHFLQVVRAIAINESAVEQRERLERLRKRLLVGQTAGRAALELEAIGSAEAKLTLKEGLENPDPEVRFYSADALAYLGDPSGVAILTAAARNEPAFRVFALAALSTLDRDAAVQDSLRQLMTQPTVEHRDGGERETWSAETRYGAFRALVSSNRGSELIQGEAVYGESSLNQDDPKSETKKEKKKPRPEFLLYVIDSPGEPMVHLTRHRKSELTVFGADQRLRTPLSLQAGKILITAQSGSDEITISRFEPNREPRQIKTSTRLVDVIRAIGKLDGSYPDVAQMLVTAERHTNLEGRLEFDALPKAGRIYYRKGVGTELADGERKIRVGTEEQAPNMFPVAGTPKDRRFAQGPVGDSSEETEDDSGSASIADAGDTDESSQDQPTAKDDDGDDAPKRRGLFNLFQRK